MEGRRRTIEVHQVLHGYRDGHEMLQASFDGASTSARRTLLSLSDLSGDGVTPPFYRYLTGYPLRREGRYAFACTWYAEEMKRPGCVWTHTLLIAFGDLPLLNDLSELRAHFVRPNKPNNFEAYAAVLQHELGREDTQPSDAAPAQVASLLMALYGNDRPVLIPASSSSAYEELILRAWSQQWPRLRRSCTFCTGALSPRRLDKNPFDIQAIPLGRMRQAVRNSGDTYAVADIASAEVPSEVEKDAPWLATATADFLRPESALRPFLRRFGADVPGERGSFRKLVTTFVTVSDPEPTEDYAQDLLEELALAFPNSADAATLKVSILGGPGDGEADQLPTLKEAGVVRWLLTSRHTQAFHIGDHVLTLRVDALMRPASSAFDSVQLSWLLASRSNLNSFGTRYLALLISGLSIDELMSLFLEDRELFVRLVREAPQLATRPHVWRQPREFQRACLEGLRSDLTAADRHAIVSAVLGSPRAPVAEELLRSLGDGAVAHVLDAVHAAETPGARSQLLSSWRASLARRSAAVCEWFSTSIRHPDAKALMLVASVLGPRNDDVQRLRTDVVLAAIRDPAADLSSDERLELAGFGLSLAFSGSDGAELAAEVFPEVHRAAMRDRMPYRVWSWLAPDLPRSTNWFGLADWDRAEKLRRALAKKFLSGGWPPEILAKALRDEEARRYMRRHLLSTSGGRALLKASGLDR